MIKKSQMTGKLEFIGAINSNPLSNLFCQKMAKVKNSICSECYSCSALKTFRKNCVPVFENNSLELSKNLPENEIASIKIHEAFFRFNAHGEIINSIHLDNLMKIVKHNPQTFFALWTKRKDLIQKWLRKNEKPENVNFVFSSLFLDKKERIPKGFDKVFTVYSKEIKGIEINCGAKSCFDCKICYTKNEVKFVNEKLK